MIPLNPENEQQALDILATAFHDDPVINWICDKPGFMQAFFKFTMPVFIPHQLSYMEEGGRGVASWLGPDSTLKWPFTLSTVTDIFRVAGIRGVYRLLVSSIKTERYHPKKPHYYLFAIGALPEHKGQGVGSALISHILRRCDQENMPAYLENSREQNLPFYQGHGFKVQQKITFAKGAPTLWLMWREPRPQANG